MPALPLTGVRPAAAAVLAPQVDTDPPVFADLVDAITPPALMLEWNDPWIAVQSIAGAMGGYTATLNIIAFAARLEPGPGIGVLENLVVLVLTRFQADQYPWALSQAQAPRRFDIGGIPLLGVRLTFDVPVSIQ